MEKLNKGKNRTTLQYILVNQIKQLLYVSLWISLLFLRGCIFSQTESLYGCVTRRERKVISPWEGVAGTPRPFPIPAFEMSKDPKTDDTYPVILPFPELGLPQLVVLSLLWQRDSAKMALKWCQIVATVVMGVQLSYR